MAQSAEMSLKLKSIGFIEVAANLLLDWLPGKRFSILPESIKGNQYLFMVPLEESELLQFSSPNGKEHTL